MKLHPLKTPFAYADVVRRLSAREAGDRRVWLILRHGERPSIQPDDPTFGAASSLTPAGAEMSRKSGRLLAGLPEPNFMASPLVRSRETASYLAEGMGKAGARGGVTAAAGAGEGGIFAENPLEMHRSYSRYGVREASDIWMTGGHLPGFVDAREGTERFIGWLASLRRPTRTTILVTHDVWIAAILNVAGAAEVRSSRWVAFLQGACVFETAPDEYDVAYCVPEAGDTLQPFFM